MVVAEGLELQLSSKRVWHQGGVGLGEEDGGGVVD